MSDATENIIDVEVVEVVIDDDQEQLNELDAILAEATEVDGGVVDDSGNIVEQSETMDIDTSELLFPIISSGFDIFAADWNVKPKEKKALAEAYGALLDKYFPNAAESLGAELTALTITAMIVAPRMLKQPPEEPKEKTVKTTAKNQPDYGFTYQPLIQETEGFTLD